MYINRALWSCLYSDPLEEIQQDFPLAQFSLLSPFQKPEPLVALLFNSSNNKKPSEDFLCAS